MRMLSALLLGTGTLALSVAHAADDAPTTTPAAPTPPAKGHEPADGKVHSLATVTVNSKRQHAPQVSSGALGTRSDLETPFSTRVVKQQELEDRQVKALGKVFAEDAAVLCWATPIRSTRIRSTCAASRSTTTTATRSTACRST
ncbi:hypothetical protein [Burkholderia ubonensis]|uniref:hypothetical protein n=1 Tax=Burkholderia ubonensis TaxID=101571 RepID=UPI000A64A1A3|nr:hypothetical protein [Burkholderia ubonensis]